MSRLIGIPPDQIDNGPVMFSASGLPRLWHMLYMKIPLVHKKMREIDPNREPGGTETILSIDTGYNPHDYLPTPVAGRSFVGERWDRASNPHGNHTMGTALGRVDANGVALGVAPGAQLIVAQGLSSGGSGSTRGLNSGRNWGVREGATITIESFGDGGGPPMREDIDSYEQAYSDGLSIACTALGNSGGRGVGRPGSYRVNIGIANFKEDGKIAPSSSRGKQADLACPGTNIVSCGVRNDLRSMTGTSMATPFMSGCMALIIHFMKITGYPVPQGPEAWREWLYQDEFLDDAGEPGHDWSYGAGIPQMDKIFDMIINYEWV